MKQLTRFAYVIFILLNGCSSSNNPNSIDIIIPEKLSPACSPTASTDGSVPLRDKYGFIQKVVVTKDNASLYHNNSDNSIKGSVPLWTFLEVYERASNRCLVGFFGQGPLGWIDQNYLSSWTHTVAVRVKEGVLPGQAVYYESINREGLTGSRYTSGDMGPLAILPVSDVRLIAPTKDGIQQRVYQVLATYLSTTTDEHIAMSVWIYPDPNVFEFVVMSTKESLTEAQQQIVFAQKQLRLEDEVAIADILASTSLEAQGMGRDQSTDVHTFLNLCSQLPLITSNNPLEATQDENKKNVTLLEYNRSGDEITDILLNWGSESVQPIPASVFPFIPTNEREYSPCRS